MPKTTIKTLIQRWRKDINLFSRDVLKFEATHQQCEIFKAVQNNRFVAVKSGHGIGKSTVFAACTWWFLICFEDAQVPCTAASADQLKFVFWDRLKYFYNILPVELSEKWKITDTTIRTKNPSNSFAVARTTRPEKTDAFQGFHSKNLLMIADEASGIPDDTFKPVLGAITEANNKIILIGNPTRKTGFFAECFNPSNKIWTTLTFSSIDSPLVTEEFINYWKSVGEDTDDYRVRVLGEFPRQDTQGLFPVDLIEEAMASDIPKRTPIVWGVDIAGFGDDLCVIAKRYGNVISDDIVLYKRNKHDPFPIANWVVNEFQRTPDEEKPIVIFLDMIGIGHEVYTRLHELNLPVRDIYVNRTSLYENKYPNIRAQMYCEMKSAMEKRSIKLPNNEQLKKELLTITYTYDKKGRIMLTSKVALKKMHRFSPDIADAIALTGIERVYDSPWMQGHKQSNYLKEFIL